MVLAFHVNQYYGINHIAQALQPLDIGYRAIRKSFVALQPPIELQMPIIVSIPNNNSILSTINVKRIELYANYTCGYRSKSSCKWPAVGRGDGNS